MKNQFEIFSGEIIKKGECVLNTTNRAFRYGDGLFETIRVSNNSCLFFNDHMNRLESAMEYLRLQWPDAFTSQDIENNINVLLKANQIENGRLRLTVYRDADGLYRPDSNKVAWHISVDPLPYSIYTLQLKGLLVCSFPEVSKPANQLSNLKTLNSLPYIVASNFAKEKGVDDVLIFNTNKEIIESANSNIFIRQGKKFFTPPLSSGCLDGIMRKQVVRLLMKNGIEITEALIDPEDLKKSDELLLTNVITGISWIEKMDEKIFVTEYAGLITQWLNEEITTVN